MRGLWMSTWLVGCLMCVCLPLKVLSDFNGPDNITVKETADVQLTCSSQSGVAITFGTWVDSDGTITSGETLIKDTGKYSNFELVADYANGQYDLRINNAEYEDEGMYSCQIGAEVAKSAMLTVEAQVTSVTLTVNGASGSSVDVKAGEEQTLVCTAVGARPRVGIDWTNDGTSISGDTETESINGDTTTTISTLLYTPTRNDNGHQIQCVTTGQQAAAPQSQSVILNVQFAPVNVKADYSKGTISCSSDANPTVLDNQYVIILNDTDTSTGKTLSYDPETNSNGCTTVKCTATNNIGTATGSLAEPLCPGATTTPTTSTEPSTTKKDGNGNDKSTNGAVIAVAVIIPIVVVIIIILVFICYKQKKICFAPSKTGSGGTIPKKQPSASNADMIRNQPEVRQSVHKYDDEPKKPRIPRSSTGNSKKQPVNDAPRQSGGSPDDHPRGYPADNPDGRDQESGGQGSVNYADLEFKNRQGGTNGGGQIHYPEEQTQYASILV